MSNESIKSKSNIEKEIIANALLEASQNLINKIENNIEEIEILKSKLKGGKEQREKREDVENYSHQEEIFGFSKK